MKGVREDLVALYGLGRTSHAESRTFLFENRGVRRLVVDDVHKAFLSHPIIPGAGPTSRVFRLICISLGLVFTGFFVILIHICINDSFKNQLSGLEWIT